MNMPVQKKHAPATLRNREPILAVLKDCLPPHGTILEIASGSGQHASYFIEYLPGNYWQPSDPDSKSRDSISAWWWEVQLNNILPPLDINTRDAVWAIETIKLPQPVTSFVCINMIHISPWESTVGLMDGAARILPKDGILYLYGPYKRDHLHTAPSNELFDIKLRDQNPDWGIRDLNDVKELAQEKGLEFVKTIEMPANNLSIIFKKTD
ncbi:SAM-dependent methyltransferases [hydrothermal vent metagenome]|uniref:SAM-dependent methyltransferases n=1 Tax=hydrothermal vent metagenome TaxID=652676 RepID=A0A3B1AR51_9ZZZZ